MATIQYRDHEPYIGETKLWNTNNHLLSKIEKAARDAGKQGMLFDDAGYRNYEISDEQAAELLAHTKSEETKFAAWQNRSLAVVTADCGHTVEKSLLMSGSRGTACPDCYDRMSE